MRRAGYLTSAGIVVGVLSWGSGAFAQESQCFVDNEGGNDSNGGTSEAEPVASLSAIPSGCTTVRFKRGNIYEGKLDPAQARGVTTFTNYGDAGLPLPLFRVPNSAGSGPVLQSFGGMMGGGSSAGLVINGLHFSGARGTGAMGDLAGGIGVMLGNDNLFVNNEISDCDIGMMLSGTGNKVINNYVHDLVMGVDSDPSTDANVVGGAEGIFINNSDNEVAYNDFVRCTGFAEWVDSRGESNCDGGATEVSVPADGAVTGVKIHHNFSYASCGFLELATVFSEGMGTMSDSEIYSNVSVESQWLVLLQVSNTEFSNVHFYNNTLYRSNGDQFTWFLIADSVMASGKIGGELLPGEVTATNNLFVIAGTKPQFGMTSYVPEEVGDGGGNLEIWTGDAPNLLVNERGARASDYALAEGSPAIDAGVEIPGHTVDFLGNAVPVGAAPDVGAFEYGSTEKVGASGSTMLVHVGDAPVDPSDFNPDAGQYTIVDTAPRGFGTGVVFDPNDLPVDALGGTVTGDGPPESSVGTVGGGVPAGAEVPSTGAGGVEDASGLTGGIPDVGNGATGGVVMGNPTGGVEDVGTAAGGVDSVGATTGGVGNSGPTTGAGASPGGGATPGTGTATGTGAVAGTGAATGTGTSTGTGDGPTTGTGSGPTRDTGSSTGVATAAGGASPASSGIPTGSGATSSQTTTSAGGAGSVDAASGPAATDDNDAAPDQMSGTSDASAPGEDDGGGCSVSGASRSGGAGLFAGILALSLLGKRRRARRAG